MTQSEISVTDIDPSLPIPLYYQLKILLKKQIEIGELRPGDKVSTEAELCERFSISRTPVRQALLELVNEGMLTRKAGRGTFVASVSVNGVDLRIMVPDVGRQWPLQEAARRWNLAHPGSAINLQFTVVPLRELFEQLSMSVAHGQAPDMSVLDSVWVAEFANRRYLYPIAELGPEWVVEVRDSLYPSLLATNSFNGELYAVPTNADTSVLWYRRDWLSAEGLASPETWSDLLEVGRHFRLPEVRARYGLGPYPLVFVGGRAGGETTTYQLLPFLWAAGGSMIAQGKVDLDSAATREALTFLTNLVHLEKLASPAVVQQPWNGALYAFAHGEVVMALGGTYENYLIRSEANWDMDTFLDRAGFLPLPAGPSGEPATLVGGMTFGIYRQSRHAMEALALLQQMITLEILKPFSLRTGHNSAHVAVAESIRPEENRFLGLTASLFTKARSRPSLPSYNQVSVQFQEMIEACLTGQLSVEEAIRRAAERISGITGLPVA
jgi:ABC-type glycerol-3-phosphate transport system substrate-binding protein